MNNPQPRVPDSAKKLETLCVFMLANELMRKMLHLYCYRNPQHQRFFDSYPSLYCHGLRDPFKAIMFDHRIFILTSSGFHIARHFHIHTFDLGVRISWCYHYVPHTASHLYVTGKKRYRKLFSPSLHKQYYVVIWRCITVFYISSCFNYFTFLRLKGVVI